MTDYVGRYAPSPTGDLHLGNALTALLAWGRARQAGGRCLLRIEDLDRARCIDGASERLQDDLQWLGLDFDGPVWFQSERLPHYERALEVLQRAGRIYACECSRKDLARLPSAPHDGEDGPPYPGLCRDKGLPLDAPGVALRFRVAPGRMHVRDAYAGTFEQDVAQEVGDIVVKRKDGVFAYQLAVVVDDALAGVTEVVRGHDLLSSTPRQIQLFEALGYPPPAFAHGPLLTDPHGQRLAKRAGGQTLRALRAQHQTPRDVLGLLARAIGIPHAPLDARDFAAHLPAGPLARVSVALPHG